MADALEPLRLALAAEPRIALAHHPLALSWRESGVLEMSGTLPSLAAKKLALGIAVAAPGVLQVMDGLSVLAEFPRADAALREDLRDALLDDPLFRQCVLREMQPDRTVAMLHDPDSPVGDLCYGAADGWIHWQGATSDITVKRLASVMAWWVPGVCDVTNQIDAPDDNGDGLAAAVRLAHQRDPFLAAGNISVSARDGIVTLSGHVANPQQRALAEDDAWAVWDTVAVRNRLALPTPAAARVT